VPTRYTNGSSSVLDFYFIRGQDMLTDENVDISPVKNGGGGGGLNRIL